MLRWLSSESYIIFFVLHWLLLAYLHVKHVARYISGLHAFIVKCEGKIFDEHSFDRRLSFYRFVKPNMKSCDSSILGACN